MTIAKKILLLTTSLNMGGAEMQVFLLAKEFAQLGHAVVVVSMVPPLYFHRELEGLGVRVLDLEMKPGKPSLTAFAKYLFFVLKWQPDVIHSHMFHANLFSRIGRLFHPTVRLISTAHNINEVEGSFFRYLFYRLTRSLSSLNTNVSLLATKHYIDNGIFPPKKTRCVYNGIDVRKFSSPKLTTIGRGGDRFVWLVVGRFVPAKDFPNLIAAIKILNINGWLAKLNVYVNFVGDGPLQKDIKELVQNSDFSDRVSFLGVRSDIADLMYQSDALVMSSAWEGLPITLLEAGASGLPCVATDVGGIREVLESVDPSWIVPPNNSDALAGAMLTLMTLDRTRTDLIREKFREFVCENFDIKNVAQEWLLIYFGVLNESYSRH